MKPLLAFLCLISTSWAAGEAELIAVLGARARAGLTRHAPITDAPPKGNGAKETGPTELTPDQQQGPTPLKPDEMVIPTVPKQAPPKPEAIRIPIASLDTLPAVGISYSNESPVAVSAAVSHAPIEVTGYVMPNPDFNPRFPVSASNPREGKCEPCRMSKASIKGGNARVKVNWMVGPPPKIEAMYPTFVWNDSTGSPLFVQGYHSMASLQNAVFSPKNNPPAELPKGVDSVAYGARQSGNMGNIAAREHVDLGLSWIEQYVGQNNPMTFEWDRSSDTNRFDLLHAKGQWTGPAIFGRSGRIRISVKGKTSLPTDQFAFTYRLEGHDLVIDPEAINLPGMADKLGPNQEASSEGPAMGAAYGFDPMTIWTIFSVMRLIWQACHPTCDLELPGHIQCDAVLVGQQLRIRFTNMPKIRFVWFWTFMLGIQTVTVDSNTLHIDFVGSRFVHWREFSIVPSGTSGATEEEREALPLEVYDAPEKPQAKAVPKAKEHIIPTVPKATVSHRTPADWHSHRCDHRGTIHASKQPTVWTHSASNNPSHQCPTCGKYQYVIHQWLGQAA